jgi:hypothetical protein
MEATRLRFLLPLSLLLLLVSVLDASARNEENARALMALKCALDPAGRFLGSWDPSGDPCSASFDGVECDRTGRVTVVSLQGRGLSGILPPAVAGLRRLQGLYLHYNGIRGVIPREIGKLSELADLYLDVNHLAGPVPVEIAAMASLQGGFFFRFCGVYLGSMCWFLAVKLEEGELPARRFGHQDSRLHFELVVIGLLVNGASLGV